MMLEVIVQNVKEAIQAENLGADRIELVSVIQEGGLTPGYSTMKQVLSSVSIPVQVMVRPHSNHFYYTTEDMKIIKEDIKRIIEFGGERIVFGALDVNNAINEQILVDILNIYPQLDITFHRAFDDVLSQTEAYQTLTKYKRNVKRILTSGGEEDCWKGQKKLRDLVLTAKRNSGPKIMPGSGLSLQNIEEIHDIVQADQYHFGKAVRIDHSFTNGFDAQIMNKIKSVI
ncbi:copper homeostasis protein CutC [Virgibacillus phasianinus]|uniref:PF03932 family protein CutC n=1 Tax=Virgibacillus phasianinus TaxID=2017483 RepID=A0A220U3B6_9BACI|nr:copper homeostasis protein CutC [Virgibacillus phasianinus]ASK62535.1 copper homeostasis protein CutC [Virgibacillus phasianinus]